MNYQLYIKCESVMERMVLLAYLFSCGYVWHRGLSGESTNPQDIENQYGFDPYDIVVIYLEEKELAGNNSSYCRDRMTFQEFLKDQEVLKPQINKLTVQLTDEYDADVYNDRIQVGCQTISLETFDVLAKAVEAMRKTPPTI